MVEGAALGANVGDSMNGKREERRESVKSSSSSRWRSTGWAPLAYPSSSFYRSSVPNPYFPLHRDVMLAATRELLVIDGTIDGNTLEMNTKSSMSRTPSDPQMTKDQATDCGINEQFSADESSKRENPRGGALGPSIPAGEHDKVANSAVTVEEEPQEEEEDGKARQDHPSAEAFADSIVKKSLIVSLSGDDLVFGAVDANIDHASSSTVERPPRKVSDADYGSTSSQILLQDATVAGEGRDLSLFLNLSERNSDGSYPLLRWDLPPLLVVSIVSESKLREAAQQMTTKLTARFEDNSLRQFLGYKSSVMKRDRLLRVLSEFLFDVSHAMFAWEETENEILSERASNTQSSPSKLDAAVRDSLFDKRALSKIGGFDNSSLLPHAVSIGRLRKRNVRWTEFAKSGTGRRMLRHHRNGMSFAAGQKRRGQRLRPRILKRQCDEGRRSRSSSVTSSDGTESEGEATKGPISTFDADFEQANDVVDLFDGMPDKMRLNLKRQPGKSWGVLLSKEGEHCLVVRAPEDTGGKDCSNAGLCCGDMILTVENERGETVIPPSNSVGNSESSDWFRDVVNLFKTSCELHFLVRRVGSLRNGGCIEN